MHEASHLGIHCEEHGDIGIGGGGGGGGMHCEEHGDFGIGGGGGGSCKTYCIDRIYSLILQTYTHNTCVSAMWLAAIRADIINPLPALLSVSFPRNSLKFLPNQILLWGPDFA
ncbi:unnamed protein product [Strongylus vulgaris]|uniref:Uncharacterized protein n=1 Tax=Strongylus vulgaris TaxID=40348 RepID=A0A3P7LI17_STRVU|nr:unnamed protein product [Strongylus vulgaris]